MFPLRDHNPSGRTPYVVYLLMAANILGYLWYSTSFPTDRSMALFYATFAAVPREIMMEEAPLTLLTSMFIHGGIMHLAGNMLFLWIFGDNMEDEMGHLPFLLFYLVSGVGATLVHVMSAPMSNVPLVGASGAIAGVMGGYLLMFPKARVDILIILIIFFRIIPIPAFIMLGLWLAMQFFGGLNADPNLGGVAYWAHAGGFFIGLALTVPLWLKRGGPRYWSRTHGQPPHPETTYSASRIPRVARNLPRRPSGPWGK
ncbi:rhomboid family intramembrane serine protease [Tritonibacter mobilis]|uniref:Rhomboid family intramembrane serine protease n=1 Tax=Tritonibacter mobilis F1926 TaxID=1265309 RepID=A0A1B1A6Q5_9RHOB|nr:rhomboid family intramembrane serine protease [Tritonibacter mobilis]ANP42197.1 rhomboid family intramembrane serine protease [Tritonibacter mobilis F1926]KJZ22299.1 peptidase C54 [Tritonibacter mobilis]